MRRHYNYFYIANTNYVIAVMIMSEDTTTQQDSTNITIPTIKPAMSNSNVIVGVVVGAVTFIVLISSITSVIISVIKRRKTETVTPKL